MSTSSKALSCASKSKLMDTSDVSMLNQLQSVKGRCTIKVRVIRVWKQSFRNNPKETFSLEMILMDEEGNKVQASVLVKWLIKFQKHLADFQCLLIKDASVGQNLAKVKYVDVSQKVSLLPDTSVTRCTDFGGPLYGFAFASFDLLSTNPFEENHSVDIIGLVHSVSGIEDVKLKNSDKICKRFSIIVEDLEGITLNITLWDLYAEQMNDFIKAHPHQSNLVIILQFGLFKFYDGRPSVSNGFNATRLLINEEIDEISTFKKQLLDANKGQGSSGYHVTKSISLQDDFLDEESGIASLLLTGGRTAHSRFLIPLNVIADSSDPISELIEFVYPSILDNFKNPTFFQERAILAPKNEVVSELNDRLLSLFPGEEKEYLSSDSLCPSDYVHDNFDANLYSPDVLNGLKISGLPDHRLVLKVGVPVMLLRNIDQKSGLCNGTRLQIISLGKRVIEAELISGSNIGHRTLIPRISLTPSDKKIPFKFQRRQFSIRVCFAMTINKSQGQSLSRVGLFLKNPVFTHGQLYVALSRVKSRSGLKLLIVDKDGNVTNKTSNVVYKEIFTNL